MRGVAGSEGCFYVLMTKSQTKIGMRVQLVYPERGGVTQDQRDKELLESFIKYLDCGKVSLPL
jgi:hypothetical protein